MRSSPLAEVLDDERFQEAFAEYEVDFGADEDAVYTPAITLWALVSQVQSKPVPGRILLVDGFTVTAADTEANQAEYPQNPAQAEGLGFPITRAAGWWSWISGA